MVLLCVAILRLNTTSSLPKTEITVLQTTHSEIKNHTEHKEHIKSKGHLINKKIQGLYISLTIYLKSMYYKYTFQLLTLLT